MNVLSKPYRNIFEKVFARAMHGHIKVAAIFLVILWTTCRFIIMQHFLKHFVNSSSDVVGNFTRNYAETLIGILYECS